MAWKFVEPQRGVWDFEKPDWYVQQASQHHVELMFSLGYMPVWASGAPDKDCGVGRGECSEPKDLNDWRDYIRTLATRYKGRVHYYEIWNEPNDQKMYYTGTIAGMVKLTQAASEVLKQVDPNNRVVSPSAVSLAGITWLDQFLRAGGGKYCDIIGYHFYVAPGPPEGVYNYVHKVQAVMSKNGLTITPLWNTEIGWAGITIDDATQAAYLVRTLILLRAAGTGRAIWFSWGNRHVGLTLHMAEPDRQTPTSAGRAFAVLQDWMVGASVGPCLADDQPEPFKASHSVWTCELNRDGKISRIVWNPDGNTNFTVPAAWNVQRIGDLSGTFRSMQAQKQIPIDQQPLLLAAY
jgi:hypothetical protein